MAIMFGIKGYVFYNADRSVIIEASGKPSKLEKFTQYCQLGNSCSIVENMEVNNNADHPAEPFKVINI
ncbi:MAG: hypothetical protein DRJ05_06360 [Bacteroidetes bacterium]|nr:MAG: hypothetical protein DRJ05_06360 [Bacteroidota bacterium]